MSIAVSPSLVSVAAARIGPDHDGEAVRLGLLGHLADLLHHLELVVGAGIDREADRRAAEPQRVLDRAGAPPGPSCAASELELLTLRMVGIAPAKVSAPASIMPSGAA